MWKRPLFLLPSAGRLVTLFASLLAPLAALAAGVEKPQLKFSLDWVYTGAHAPFLLAADGGHFRRNGLEVTVERGLGASETVRRVADGEFDFGVTDLSAVIQHNLRHPSNAVTAFYLVHEQSPLAVISLEERGIRAPADLEGKVLGAPEGEAGRVTFPLFAAAARIDPGRVRWRSMEPALRESLLVAGEVDAITGYSYTAQFLELQGVRRERIRVMRYSSHGLDLYSSVLFARADFLRRAPVTTAAFARSVNEALLASIAQPELAIDALKRRLGDRMRADIELQRLRGALEEAVVTPAARRQGLSQVDPARLQRHLELIARAMGTPPPPPGTVYTEAYLPPRPQRMLPGAPRVTASAAGLACPRASARPEAGPAACR